MRWCGRVASTPTRGSVKPLDGPFCSTRKIGWETKDAAHDVAERMMLVGDVEPGCHITPYHCAECGRWHVGNRRIVFVGGRRGGKHTQEEVE